MSASSVFGSQSSRSPQARAPITIPISLFPLTPFRLLSLPFLPFPNRFLFLESGSDRNALLLFAFVPLYFALVP